MATSRYKAVLLPRGQMAKTYAFQIDVKTGNAMDAVRYDNRKMMPKGFVRG